MSSVREPTQTDRGRDSPSIRQLSVFTENRLGALARIVEVFETSSVRILALTVIQGFDCAIVRFVFSDTDLAAQLLTTANYRFSICDLVAVQMPPGHHALSRIAKCLLSAEIDLHYCYALITNEHLRPAIVIHVDNVALAVSVLSEHHFALLDETDLRF